MLALAAGFVAVALLLPDRLTRLTLRRPLEIGQLVETLQTEVKALEEERQKVAHARQVEHDVRRVSSALEAEMAELRF